MLGNKCVCLVNTIFQRALCLGERKEKSLTCVWAEDLWILDWTFLQIVDFRKVAGKRIPLRQALWEGYGCPYHLRTNASFFCLVVKALGCIRESIHWLWTAAFCTIPPEIDGEWRPRAGGAGLGGSSSQDLVPIKREPCPWGAPCSSWAEATLPCLAEY